MKSRISLSIGAGVLAVMGIVAGSLAQDKQPPMHHHKVEMSMPDKEASSEFKADAAQLREKAQEHRTLAKGYRARRGGKINYDAVARHCDQLADNFEQAAKAAEAAASELAK